MPRRPAPTETKSVYILITQCLQNSFFLSQECRLCLPFGIVKDMILGTSPSLPHIDSDTQVNQRKFDSKLLMRGPLYQFFNAVLNDQRREHDVHVIHIKDWHAPTQDYDEERRQYGAHCVADTYGAASLTEEFEPFFTPWKGVEGGLAKARSETGYQVPESHNVFYEVRSDSLHDFQRKNGNPSELQHILDRLIKPEPAETQIYVVVIGVYTDIKIMTLMTTLSALYDIDNLIVSDVLTAAPTLERHIAGLDYCEKVLKVEVIHSLNELASVFNPRHMTSIPLDITQTNPDFRQYHSYFQDKQSVLLFQDEKLSQYIDYTGKRTSDLYRFNYRVNTFLTIFGAFMLVLTAIGGVLRFLDSTRFPVDVLIITGGLSTLQVLTFFIRKPLQNTQNNLNALVRLRNYLESYSTVTALLRHHMTTPTLLNLTSPSSAKDSHVDASLKHLDKMLLTLHTTFERMSENFRDITQEEDDGENQQAAASSGTNTNQNSGEGSAGG